MKTTQSLIDPELLHDTFLALLPIIETQARKLFSDIRCGDRRADRVADTVALAWHWFRRLAERGRDVRRFPITFAYFAARAVRGGRRVTGQLKPKDVLSPRAQQRRGFTVSSLPQGSGLYGTVFDDALRDNTQSEIPEQVAFRMDFPAWLATLAERDRRLAEDLAIGHRAKDVSHKYGLSPGRVSQLRGRFQQDWQRFGDDPYDQSTATV